MNDHSNQTASSPRGTAGRGMFTKARALTATIALGAGLIAGIGTTAPATAVVDGALTTEPWIVAVLGTGKCTGVQVSESLILTAKHCGLPGYAGVSYVTQPNATYPPYDLGGIDWARDSAVGDVTIAHLSKPHPLSSYPRLNLSYQPAVGDAGTIYGLGEPTFGSQTSGSVTVVTPSVVQGGGPSIGVRGNGTRIGDSGGPLIVDGAVVGILYGSNQAYDSYYSYLSSPENAALIASELPGVGVGNFGGVSTVPYYEIKNVATGLALDVRDSSTSVGAQTTQQPFTGATSQQWTLIRDGSDVRIVNRKSGLVVGVPGGSHAVGEGTIQWNAVGVRDQAWTKVQQADGTFTFTNGESGQLLSVPTTAAGGSVVQDNAHGTDAQKWTVTRVG